MTTKEKIMITKEKKEPPLLKGLLIISFITLSAILLIHASKAADPQGPDQLVSVNNSTKGNVTALMFNVSGGYIAKFNLSATLQNPHWKAFVGNVTGKFTLDDADGETIYDWTLSTISGRVYATRNSTSISWAGINCSNNTYLELENIAMNHSNSEDNITKTFNNRTHDSFWVGGTNILAGSCPTLRTYVNDIPQSATDYFQEMVLYDDVSHVFVTVLENNIAGYDDEEYDFQMIVPEIGIPGFGGATAYYLYIELG